MRYNRVIRDRLWRGNERGLRPREVLVKISIAAPHVCVDQVSFEQYHRCCLELYIGLISALPENVKGVIEVVLFTFLPPDRKLDERTPSIDAKVVLNLNGAFSPKIEIVPGKIVLNFQSSERRMIDSHVYGTIIRDMMRVLSREAQAGFWRTAVRSPSPYRGATVHAAAGVVHSPLATQTPPWRARVPGAVCFYNRR